MNPVPKVFRNVTGTATTRLLDMVDNRVSATTNRRSFAMIILVQVKPFSKRSLSVCLLLQIRRQENRANVNRFRHATFSAWRQKHIDVQVKHCVRAKENLIPKHSIRSILRILNSSCVFFFFFFSSCRRPLSRRMLDRNKRRSMHLWLYM